MRVMFDLQAFSMQEYGGVSRYVAEVAGGIRRFHDEVDVVYGGRFASENIHLGAFGFEPDTRLHTYRGRGRGRLMLLADALNQRLVDRDLRAGRADVLHATYYHTHTAPDIEVPVVLTVHDMIHELFEDMPQRQWMIERKRAAIARADRIIVPSQSTADDLVRIRDVDPADITVVPHGSTFTGDEPIDPRLDLPQDYLLYVGVRYSYKGFGEFCRAVAQLSKAHPGLKGVVAGGGGFSLSERALIDELDIAGSMIHVPCDDRCLPTIYRRARLFVAPSQYEGFGLPVVEAMQFGTPAVVSASSSLPEVGGDAVAYFDPGSADSLVEVAGALLEDASARERMTAAGLERARSFSWRASVDAHVAVYSEITSS